MGFGTVYAKNKIYNLEFMTSYEMEELLKDRNDINKYVVLNRVYEYKLSIESINKKIDNQIKSIDVSINSINRKFIESSKNYELVKDESDKIMKEYMKYLKRISYKYDYRIEKYLLLILKYTKKLSQKKYSEEKVLKIKEAIKENERKRRKLSREKIKCIYNAFESDEKRMGTKISKPRSFEKLTRFFSNKFNTYNVIIKNILSPIRQRMEDYLIENLDIDDIEYVEFDLNEFKNKIEEIVKQN